MLSSLFALLGSESLFWMLRVSPVTGSFPQPLSAAREREALLAMQEGDAAARDLLIEHNLRLVAHVVKKYYASREDQDDLVSIGTIGLIKAVSTFKPDKNTRLATYACRCIENAILSQRNKLNLEAKTSHHVAKNGAYSVTYADTGMS